MKEKIINKDLFGNDIIEDVILRDKFIENPFTVIDTKGGNYANRKRQWIAKGLKSEIGRDAKAFNIKEWADDNSKVGTIPGNTSIFNPAVTEVLYHWFCKKGGTILDPFAGGSVRGIVANYLGYKYTGIDIRQEQIDSNREQAINILSINNQPQWYVGDSNIVLDGMTSKYDFLFSCPPYADLEVYSDLEGDISNMPYNKFLMSYQSIISKSCNLLKSGGYACFVVGEIRDKKGNYIGFVPDTYSAFKKCGMLYYNEAILLNNIVTAQLRAGGNMKTQKLVKVHQNILVFKKP